MMLPVHLLTVLATTCAATKLAASNWAGTLGDKALHSSMPLFYFAAGSCYPQPAEVNGKQAHGGRHFAYTKIDRDCQHRIPKHRPKNSPGPVVPVYYAVRPCPDGTMRVLYDLYFSHDSGHSHDFEWVVVVWRYSNETKEFYRDSIFLEQDNRHPRHPWKDFGTFFNETDMHEWHKNETAYHGDHPRIYVDKWQHAMWWNSYTAAFEGDGAVLPKHRWRTNDWYLYNQTASLTPISVIDKAWDYGKAENPHKTADEMCDF